MFKGKWGRVCSRGNGKADMTKTLFPPVHQVTHDTRKSILHLIIAFSNGSYCLEQWKLLPKLPSKVVPAAG